MADKIEHKESLNPVADRVEKRTKEISIKSERIVNDGLDVLKDFMFKLLVIRPREFRSRDFKPREFRRKDSGDKK